MPTTCANGNDVGYDILGEGAPLLLLTGLGCQRLMWPDGLCDALAMRGFRVLRTDHRDVGESSRTPGPLLPTW